MTDPKPKKVAVATDVLEAARDLLKKRSWTVAQLRRAAGMEKNSLRQLLEPDFKGNGKTIDGLSAYLVTQGYDIRVDPPQPKEEPQS